MIDGAEGNAFVVGGELFGASGVDFGLEVEGANYFAEEGGFFVLGFGEGDVDAGPDEGDGDAWEPGAGAIVEEGCDVGGKVLGAEDGFDEVTAEDAFVVADGGEVGFLVPALEELEVGGEFFGEAGCEGWGIGFGKDLVEGGHGRRVAGCLFGGVCGSGAGDVRSGW